MPEVRSDLEGAPLAQWLGGWSQRQFKPREAVTLKSNAEREKQKSRKRVEEAKKEESQLLRSHVGNEASEKGSLQKSREGVAAVEEPILGRDMTGGEPKGPDDLKPVNILKKGDLGEPEPRKPLPKRN